MAQANPQDWIFNEHDSTFFYLLFFIIYFLFFFRYLKGWVLNNANLRLSSLPSTNDSRTAYIRWLLSLCLACAAFQYTARFLIFHLLHFCITPPDGGLVAGHKTDFTLEEFFSHFKYGIWG